MPRSSSSYGCASFSFGFGPPSTALRPLIGTNLSVSLVQAVLAIGLPDIAARSRWYLGLMPWQVYGQGHLWQLATYMFLHGGVFHILFNMLALWMFGAELERIWGTPYFLKFYFVTGVGAGALTVLFSLLPFAFAQQLQHSIDRKSVV